MARRWWSGRSGRKRRKTFAAGAACGETTVDKRIAEGDNVESPYLKFKLAADAEEAEARRKIAEAESCFDESPRKAAKTRRRAVERQVKDGEKSRKASSTKLVYKFGFIASIEL